MLVETLPVGPLQCNCSILACADTKEAVVVDPGGDAERILAIVKHYDLTVVAAIHTHAHLDHICATRDVKEETGALIGLHEGAQRATEIMNPIFLASDQSTRRPPQ